MPHAKTCKLFPIEALLLTSFVQPFEHHLSCLLMENLYCFKVSAYSIIVIMPSELTGYHFP